MVIEEHAALDVITKDGSTYAIDESQIIRGSLTTSQSCSSGGGIPAGSCNTGTASVAFHAPSALSYEKLFGAKVKLYVWYGDTSKKQVGVYNVTSTERSYGVYTLSLSDNVYLLDEACYSDDTTTDAQNWLAMQLGGKKVPSVIFNMICNAYSVPHWNAAKNEKAVPESGIDALSVKVPSDCCTESVKDFASYLAEYLGAIIMPDENGELHFAYMGSQTCPIAIDASNIERDTYQKSPFYVKMSSWRVNHDSGVWATWRVVGDLPDNAAPLSIVVNNNPFWQSVEDSTPEAMVHGTTLNMLRHMWVAHINNVPQINPFRCTVHVPYYFRAGDRVKIIDPITSEVYHSYVTDVTWTFRGGQQISCAGEDTRTLSVSTSRNGAKKMSDYSRYLYRKSKSNTGSVEANTYTKAEIDAKDAAVKSAADKAQGTADGAVSVNNTQNTQIASLQKSAHTHSNKGVLDKIEQPYTTAERDKLAGLENYTHPNYTAHAKGFYKFANDGLGHVSDAEKVTKDDIVDLGIPGSIPIYNVDVDGEYGYSEGMIIATIVVNQTAHHIGVPIIGENENADYGLMSASDKTKLDGISDNANNYVHPTTSGNKHIPSGGSSGQILRWSADGTAVWGADNNTTYNDATQSAHGLMTAADKKKLDGIAAGAEVNQNAFSTIATGSARYAATAKQSAFLIDGDGGTSVSLDTKTGRLTVSSHTHDNKAVLDQLNEEQWKFINGAANKAHVHDNKGTLDKITDVGWNTVYGNTHSHDNKAVLDKTTASYTAADKKKLDGMDLTKYLPKDGTAKQAEMLSSGQMRSAYCHNDDATYSNGYVWFKIGTAIASGGYATATTTFLGICGYGKHALYTARVRLTSAGNAVDSISFLESGRTGGMPTGLFRIVAINGEKNVTFELWAKIAARWEGTKIVILNEMYLDGSGKGNFWTLTSRGNADAKTATTTGNMHVDSSDSSICATATNASNATTWNGLIDDTQTKNSADPWLLVKNGNKIQHRLSSELAVKEAATLTDSGWIATTRNTSFTATSTVKCRKYGQLVEVRGEVTFNSTYGSPTVCTLPAGYRPATVVQACGITPSGKQYMIKADTSGVISFGSDSGSTFVKGTTYRVDLTYLLG